jgi:hypothetical protein
MFADMRRRWWQWFVVALCALAAGASLLLFAVLVATGTGPNYCPAWLREATRSLEVWHLLAAAAAIFTVTVLAIANRRSAN